MTHKKIEGTHIVTKNKISVRLRGDRGTLISMYVQGNQKCSVGVWCFSDSGKDETKEAEKRAVDFIVNIAKDFSMDKIEVDELYPTRNERLKALNIWPIPKNPFDARKI